MAKGIFKQKNSQYYWIRYDDGNGKIIRESSKTTSFRDAETLLIGRKKAIREGKEPEPIKRIRNYTFNELTSEYVKWAERQRSFNSKSYLINQLKDTFGNLQLRRFTPMLLEQYQTERLQNSNRPKKNGKPDTGNKPATVNRLLATLKHMFTKAGDWDMVDESVLKKVRKVKLLQENNRRLRYLSKEECRDLINSCESHLKPILITALNTGCRKGEILNLKWDNVDLTHGFILLDKTKNGHRREIPINADLRNILEKMHTGTSEKPRRIDVPYVFYDRKTGKPYGDIKRSFATACKKAKIKDFRFHDLRHTFASHLVMSGVDITSVSRLLGHQSLTMTLRYAHLAPNHLTKAVNMLSFTAEKNSTAYLLHSKAGNE